jgi:hypothetical protein
MGADSCNHCGYEWPPKPDFVRQWVAHEHLADGGIVGREILEQSELDETMAILKEKADGGDKIAEFLLATTSPVVLAFFAKASKMKGGHAHV